MSSAFAPAPSGWRGGASGLWRLPSVAPLVVRPACAAARPVVARRWRLRRPAITATAAGEPAAAAAAAAAASLAPAPAPAEAAVSMAAGALAAATTPPSASLPGAPATDATATAAAAAAANPPPSPGPPARVRLVYRDTSVVVVAKPPHLLMHRNAALDPTATTWVESQVAALVAPASVYIVSRLDCPTSGAVALAVGSPAAAAALQVALGAPSAVKEYVALVVGTPPDAAWVNDHPLRDMVGRPSSGRRRGGGRGRGRGGGGSRGGSGDSGDGAGGSGGGGSATKGGEPRPASTSFTTLVRLPEAGVALVSARLGSGRRHQVRRHLANGRLPIAGDTTHGKGAANRALRTAYGVPRMFLHARALAFDHPTVRGGRVVTAVPLPADLVECLERLPGWQPGMLDAVNRGVPWEAGGRGGGVATPNVERDTGGQGVDAGGATPPGTTVGTSLTGVDDNVP